MSAPALAWLACFAETLALELPIAALGLGRACPRRAVPSPGGRRAVVAVALVANLVTHPLVWAVCRASPTPGVALAAELFAVGLEAVLYARWVAAPWPLALGVSLVANGASLGAGLLAPMP